MHRLTASQFSCVCFFMQLRQKLKTEEEEDELFVCHSEAGEAKMVPMQKLFVVSVVIFVGAALEESWLYQPNLKRQSTPKSVLADRLGAGFKSPAMDEEHAADRKLRNLFNLNRA